MKIESKMDSIFLGCGQCRQLKEKYKINRKTLDNN
jgi:hypothetical protein